MRGKAKKRKSKLARNDYARRRKNMNDKNSRVLDRALVHQEGFPVDFPGDFPGDSPELVVSQEASPAPVGKFEVGVTHVWTRKVKPDD